jgi:5-formyltetrahydrofolate cyclo-ligase
VDLADLAASKRELRRQMRARRRALDRPAAAAEAALVAEAVVETPEFQCAPALALYAALPDEISTQGIFERAAAVSKPCFFPRCAPGTALEFVAVDEWEALRPGRYGVREPAADLAAGSLAPGSLVIVPGIAFDRRGYRLGQGKGYYDRAFPSRDPRRLRLFGVGFAFQLLDSVPVGEFDRAMDAVVTERGILRPESATPGGGGTRPGGRRNEGGGR